MRTLLIGLFLAASSARADTIPDTILRGPDVVNIPNTDLQGQRWNYYWSGFWAALNAPRDILNQDWTPLIRQSEFLSMLFGMSGDDFAAYYFQGQALGWKRKKWIDENP
jgi:hypothetical protein